MSVSGRNCTKTELRRQITARSDRDATLRPQRISARAQVPRPRVGRVWMRQTSASRLESARFGGESGHAAQHRGGDERGSWVGSNPGVERTVPSLLEVLGRRGDRARARDSGSLSLRDWRLCLNVAR